VAYSIKGSDGCPAGPDCTGVHGDLKGYVVVGDPVLNAGMMGDVETGSHVVYLPAEVFWNIIIEMLGEDDEYLDQAIEGDDEDDDDGLNRLIGRVGFSE
jgi:hypothetical protein